MSKFIRAVAFAAVSATTLLAATGCSVARDQQSVGSYVDDAAITTAVKAKMAEVDSMMNPPCGPTRIFIKKGTDIRHINEEMAKAWPNDLR